MKRTSLNRISVSCGKLLNNPRAARRNRVCTYTRVAIILLVECVAQALVFDESRRVVDCVLLSQQRQLILNVFNSLSIRADVWMRITALCARHVHTCTCVIMLIL